MGYCNKLNIQIHLYYYFYYSLFLPLFHSPPLNITTNWERERDKEKAIILNSVRLCSAVLLFHD